MMQSIALKPRFHRSIAVKHPNRSIALPKTPLVR